MGELVKLITNFVYIDSENQTYQTHRIIESNIRAGFKQKILHDLDNRITKVRMYNNDFNLKRAEMYE